MKQIAALFARIRKLLRVAGYFSIIAVVAVCSLLSFVGLAAEQKVTDGASKPAAPAPPAEIPLADVAARATEVSNLLNNLTAAAAPVAQIENIAKSLPDLSSKLEQQIAVTTTALEAEPTLETLQTLQQQWQRYQTETSTLLNTLTQRATKLQDGLNQLAELQKIWSSTRASAQASKAPDPIRQQIETTLAAMAAGQARLQSERAAALDLQSRIAREVTRCGTALAQIAQFQQKAVAGIFAPDAPPIWRVDLWVDALRALPEHVSEVTGARLEEVVKYLREPRAGSGFLAAVFIVLALLFYLARLKIDQWTESRAPAAPALLVFARPFSAALAAALILFTSPLFQISLR